ncbi:MAG: RtcB family protein [Planctomycetes bacterium]|nr:RtcB family protein [Planctomycetota bacterium]
MTEKSYTFIEAGEGRSPIKAWVQGVHFDDNARNQLLNTAQLPIIYKWIAAMPDVHWGMGSTVGSVVPTKHAIIPAAVGVDIGCGMCAVKTTLRADQLPDDLKPVRSAIERAVPHGRTDSGGRGDRGAWSDAPQTHIDAFKPLAERYEQMTRRYQSLSRNAHPLAHLGTLGTGNHFIEMCLDESNAVWFMLHSGSRGIGNRIGTFFIELAKKDMREHIKNLPDENLAYLKEGTQHFDEYVNAVLWAQEYAMLNRRMMMESVIAAVRKVGLPGFTADVMAVNCHHNYVQRETHFGEEVLITRKGAVRAGKGDLGIIPGSMGARSYIVRGKGNPESFESCSHGAGRAMSRGEATRRFSVEDHIAATQGVECRKDKDVIDETPAAYKSIDAVMAAQSDLVEVVHTLKQVVCVKG